MYSADESLTVVVPVTSEAGALWLGNVALARSTEPLEHRLTVAARLARRWYRRPACSPRC